MSSPDIGALAGILPAVQAFINSVIAKIAEKSPDVVKADEEVIRQAIADSLQGVDIAGLTSSLESVVRVLKDGKGISGGGYNANLA